MAGGGGASVNVTAAKEPGAAAHFKRNWGKYTLTAGAAYFLKRANDKYEWVGGGGGNQTINYNVTGGRDVTIGDGNTTGDSNNEEMAE